MKKSALWATCLTVNLALACGGDDGSSAVSADAGSGADAVEAGVPPGRSPEPMDASPDTGSSTGETPAEEAGPVAQDSGSGEPTPATPSPVDTIQAQVAAALGVLIPTLDGMGNVVNPEACPEELPAGMCPPGQLLACVYDNTGCLCFQGEWSCTGGIDPSLIVSTLLPAIIGASQPTP